MNNPSDQLLVERISDGEEDAWNELIARYEGRLSAFVRGRVRTRQAAEDVVQETFVGFLTSLPNYDPRRPLEGWLFSIAAHKLTDFLRREGRRPALPMPGDGSSGAPWEPACGARAVSSVARSVERHGLEETALVRALREQIEHWRSRGQWDRLKCAELLFVRSWANKEVAQHLGIGEQAVANYKFEFIARLRSEVRQQDLPQAVFPELYEK